jgi:hypothetical protein
MSASTNAASQSEDGHDQECDPSSSEDIAELAKKGLKSGAILLMLISGIGK